MSRHLVLGNGRVLVGMDKDAHIRNFYYPYPGEEDHVRGHHHRIGVWVDGKFSWFSDPGWEKSLKYKKDTLVTEVVFSNKYLGIEVVVNDAVFHKKDIFLKKIKVKNLNPEKKTIKLFLNQHFHVGGSDIGDTVYYHPFTKSMIFYKGKNYFLINGSHKEEGFSEYAAGAADEGAKEGTYKDAENGKLSGNPIEHGSVDSTISFNFESEFDSEKIIYYWITIGNKFQEVKKLNDFVLKETPSRLMELTEKYWKRWANKNKIDLSNLDQEITDFFKRSLLIVRTHTANNGAIIASSDANLLTHKKDTYNYVWPRDGAMISRSLDRAGYKNITDSFFGFCNDIQSKEGYLFHKYLPDGSLGSSWHSWLKENKPQLPIQEDETALLVDALWKRYQVYKNKREMKTFYKQFIKKAADFMCDFRDKETGLPKESYDLWEEKLGVHTFTCATTYAGLIAAHNFAKEFKQKDDAKKYQDIAEEMRKAIIKYLYDEKQKRFIKGIYHKETKGWLKDKTIDISTLYGVFEYNILNIDDPKIENTFKKTLEKLSYTYGDVDVLIRYEDDNYFRQNKEIKGNIWFISTLWLAEYYVKKAKNLHDLEKVLNIFRWVIKHSLESGILSEQINPLTEEHLSVTPLIWSHTSFITAVTKYLEKLDELKNNKK